MDGTTSLNAVLAHSVDVSTVLATRRSAGILGWVLCDVVGKAPGFWNTALESTGHLELVGEVRGLKMHQDHPWAALEPMLAQLVTARMPGGRPVAGAVEAAASGAEKRSIQGAQRLLRAREGKGTAVVIVKNPEFLDEASAEALARLAQSGDLKLFIQVSAPSSLPAKWRRFLEAGGLVRCPEGQLQVRDASWVISEIVGYPVTSLGAVAMHQITAGQSSQIDLLLENTDPAALKTALLTGQMSNLPLIDRFSFLLRSRSSELNGNGRTLMGLCALRGHLLLKEAYRALGRADVDRVLGTGLAKRGRCCGQQIISASSPMLARHWSGNLSGFELVDLENIAADLESCCTIGLPQAIAGSLGSAFGAGTRKMIDALNAACESHFYDSAESVSAGLRRSWPRIGDLELRREAVVAVARFGYASQGPHAALRELNRAAQLDPGIWDDIAISRLLVRICLETGRLLPTLQRVASRRGLPVPQRRDDPVMLELLPADMLTRNLRLAFQATGAGNLRKAISYLAAGLKNCTAGKCTPSSNTHALRGTFLSATGVCLAMGGYTRGWEILQDYLAREPRPWQARSNPALELASGLRQLHQGKIATGELTVARAAVIASILQTESVQGLALDVESGLNRIQTIYASGFSQGSAVGYITDGRNAIEYVGMIALMRDPVMQQRLLEISAGYNDPRARTFTVAASAQLGIMDPIVAIDELLGMGQQFHAAWVADGVILSHAWAVAGYQASSPEIREVSDDPMAVVQVLLGTLDSAPVPGLDSPLISRLWLFDEESLPALPFLGHELRAREMTTREAEILGLARQGMKNRQIAKELTLSIRTVEGHMASILSKKDLKRREDLLVT